MLVQKVLSHHTGNWLLCCWTECEKPGYELYKIRLHEHNSRVPCSIGEHVFMVFCSERHRQLFAHSHRDFGKLPPGYRYVI